MKSCSNPTYDRLTGIQPSKCSRRDLIGDMARTLQKRGIRLIAYLPSGAPGQDAAARAALRAEGAGRRNRDFQLKWEQVIRDWSLRWGTNIAGWWFDGCYWPNAKNTKARRLLRSRMRMAACWRGSQAVHSPTASCSVDHRSRMDACAHHISSAIVVGVNDDFERYRTDRSAIQFVSR